MKTYLNKITLGDSLQILKELPDKCIDMILTDPPYFENMKINFDTNATQDKEKRIKNNYEKKGIGLQKRINSNFKNVENINSQVKPNDWWKEAIRVSKKINWIVFLDYRHQLKDYLDLIYEYGFKFYLLSWYKPNATPLNNVYLRDIEYALYIYDEPTNYLTQFENRKTLFSFRSNSGNNRSDEFLRGHPTPKPIPLIKKYIEKHSKKDDVILDMFSGSGTTAVCAKQLNRQFIAIELDKNYYEISLNNLESRGSQLTFDFEKCENK